MFAKRLLSLLVLAAAVAASSATPADAAKRKPARLKAFSDCSSLIGYGNRFAGREGVPVWQAPPQTTAPQPAPADSGSGTSGPQPMPAAGGGGSMESAASAPAAPQRGTDFSGTNNQEESVDEPDIVKTDGSFVYTVAGNKLHAVDVRDGATTLVSSLDLPVNAYGAEMLVSGKRAVLMWTAFVPYDTPDGPRPVASAASSPAFYGGGRQETVLAEVDISDPAAMKLVRTMTVDGRLVSSRLNGSTARVITAATPRALEVPIDTQMPVDQQRATLRAEAGAPRANQWLPRRVMRADGGQGAPRVKAAVSCRSVRRPAVFSGLDMVTVLTLDLAKGISPVDSDALMTDAETVYASEKSLYVATRKWLQAVDAALPQPTTAGPPSLRTQIHRFDISDADRTSYVGSGEVTGYLLNQFSLSEHDGVLRTATTDGPTWWPGQTVPESESAVTTLKSVGGGVLMTAGRVGGLGKGERIYAVRFIGDTGYVVTFRQTDPLYTVDVSDPEKPRVVGELKIEGYSAYLHPAGKNLLIGVGQDATAEGRRTGAQVSLFDVSDPAKPTRLHQQTLGQYSSASAEYDHHAFLYWAPTNLLMLPVQSYSEQKTFAGAIGFRVKRDSGIAELARISHPSDNSYYDPPVQRSMVIGNRVFTLSAMGMKASRLDTLADAGWVAFPNPNPYGSAHPG